MCEGLALHYHVTRILAESPRHSLTHCTSTVQNTFNYIYLDSQSCVHMVELYQPDSQKGWLPGPALRIDISDTGMESLNFLGLCFHL